MMDVKIGPVVSLKGDCLERLKELPDASIDCVVTDPPYGLGEPPEAMAMLRDWVEAGSHAGKGRGGMMGKKWDAFVPQPAVWKEVFRVLKPGGYCLAFAGTRTVDLMGLSMRLGGLEPVDSLDWLYGSGMPKGGDISKRIDKAAGATRKVVGLKTYGEGGTYNGGEASGRAGGGIMGDPAVRGPSLATEASTPEAKKYDGWSTTLKPCHEPVRVTQKPAADGSTSSPLPPNEPRWFYQGKAGKTDRDLGSGRLTKHVTVKPQALMRWLLRLVCPPGGTVLDPFGGSGSTGVAAAAEGFNAILIERGDDGEHEEQVERLEHQVRPPVGIETALWTQKPYKGSAVANLLRHGVGAMNIPAARIETKESTLRPSGRTALGIMNDDAFVPTVAPSGGDPGGRWPPNVAMEAEVAEALDETVGPLSVTGRRSSASQDAKVEGTTWGPNNHRSKEYPDSKGGPSRFFKVVDGEEEPETAFAAGGWKKP